MPIAAPLLLTIEQRVELEKIAKASTAPYRAVMRAMVLLEAADGVSNTEISARYGVSRVTVLAWRNRFVERGLDKFGQVDAGRGPKPKIPQATVEKITAMASQKDQVNRATHYSNRTAAAQTGVSHASVQRIWAGRKLKPHLVDTFKVSNDPNFEAKLVDIVGLYMNPPDHAVVLSVDELCEASHNSSDVKLFVM